MGSTDQQVPGQKQEYLTKKVRLNGQLVTLYSLNGQTWLSSPDEIPEIMARLENTRVTLNPEGQEQAAEGEEAKEGAVGEKKAADNKPADKAQAPTSPPIQIASKYRLKGPKPRPILRQNGMVFKGTPVEPFSASDVQVKVPEIKAPQKPAKGAKHKAKLKAPVLAEARAAAAAAKAAAAKAKGKKGAIVAAPKPTSPKEADALKKQAKAVPAPKAPPAAKGKAVAPPAKAAPKKAPPAKKASAAKPKLKAAKPLPKKGKSSSRRRAR